MNKTANVGTLRAIKKMTQNDNRPGPGRNYGETGVFTFDSTFITRGADWHWIYIESRDKTFHVKESDK